jgi:hypothetical protein
MGSVGDWHIAIVTNKATGDILPPGAAPLASFLAGQRSPLGAHRRHPAGPSGLAWCLLTGALGNLEGEGGCPRRHLWPRPGVRRLGRGEPPGEPPAGN